MLLDLTIDEQFWRKLLFWQIIRIGFYEKKCLIYKKKKLSAYISLS